MTIERMIGMEGAGTHHELTLVSAQGGTLLSLVITYPSQEMRDMILGTGMTTGMQASYTRLSGSCSLKRKLLAASRRDVTAARCMARAQWTRADREGRSAST